MNTLEVKLAYWRSLYDKDNQMHKIFVQQNEEYVERTLNTMKNSKKHHASSVKFYEKIIKQYEQAIARRDSLA
jgi:uncharacterized protein YbaP (TraB family)